MSDSIAAPPVSLFYSYAHEDEALRDELRGHLKILERRGLLSSWHDREIKPGEDWHQKIDAQLQMCDLVLLLVSKDFIESDYIFGNELTVAMQRHEAGLATVVPIVVRAIDIEPDDRDALPFLKLQALPTDMRPVTSWPNRDEAWTNVAKGLRATVKAIHDRKAAGQAPKRGMRPLQPIAPAPPPSAAETASDALLRDVVDGFAAKVNEAMAQRGGAPVDSGTLRAQALRLIDEPEWKRVLWVDDHPEHNAAETSALAKLQIEVQTARSTAEGIEVLSGDPRGFDLVISDWGRAWEWQAGLRLLGKVRELRPALPVVFYHGETEPQARAARAEKLLAAGAMGEAVDPGELFTLVLRALGG